jgi:hypothetical protein
MISAGDYGALTEESRYGLFGSAVRLRGCCTKILDIILVLDEVMSTADCAID